MYGQPVDSPGVPMRLASNTNRRHWRLSRAAIDVAIRIVVALSLLAGVVVPLTAVCAPHVPSPFQQKLSETAYEAYVAGKYALAASLYRQLYEDDNKLVDALYNAARAEQKAGRLHEARRAYGLFLSRATKGNRLIPKAEAYLAKVMATLRAMASAKMAREALAEGRDLVALEHYRNSVRQLPDHVPYLMARADLERRLGKLEEAAATCKQVMMLAPQTSVAYKSALTRRLEVNRALAERAAATGPGPAVSKAPRTPLPPNEAPARNPASEQPTAGPVLPAASPAGKGVDAPSMPRMRVQSTDPWYGRWWVWTAVGAVAVGSATTWLLLRAPAEAAALPEPNRVVALP